MEIPKKTFEWLSACDLRKDETFPLADTRTINKKLANFQNEMPEYIQVRKPARGGSSALCLHRNGLRLFLEKSGIEFCPPKTDEWQSALDLQLDKSFPMSSSMTINEFLQEFQAEMPEYIQRRKSSKGQSALCLHRDGRELFLKKRAEKTCPLQTDEWLSASDLKNDETFPTASVTNISKKLQKLQAEMPEYIQKRKLTKCSGNDTLCLHRNGLRLFLEKSGIEFCPPKTDEWQSALDLQGDKSFPIRDTTNINKKLAKFQNEMPEFIQKRKPAKGQSALCLHRDGRQEFIKRMQKDKTESFVRARDVVEAVNKKRSIKIILKKIIPNKQNKR